MLAGVAGITAGALLTRGVSAGPLNPPTGPIESTGKTLTEVEPRIAINDDNTPGDSSGRYAITQPGSYYLTSDVMGASGRSGIVIRASNVTIDLNGYSLIGVPGAGTGIITASGAPRNNYTIRNGSVIGWPSGGINILFGFGNSIGSLLENLNVISNGGIGIRGNACSIVRGCVVTGNGGTGIIVGADSSVSRCSVRNNTGSGILVSDNSLIRDCVATNNPGSGGNGISGGFNCVISNCAARQCGSPGNAGISALTGTIQDCTATENIGNGLTVVLGTIRSCFARSNGGSGIIIGEGASAIGCSVRQNAAHGILAQDGALLLENCCEGNGTGASGTAGAGIRMLGARGRIEGNNVSSNGRGILVEGTNNYIARNTCSNNTLNWSVAANNACLVVAATLAGAISGNAGGSSPGATNPHANFTL